MELTSVQRKITFAVIVLVLAGLGFAVFRPARHGPARAAAPARSSRSAPATLAPPSPGQRSTPSSSPASGTDIYQWLPFTQPELGAAAGLAVRFGNDYETFSYSENTARYLAPMRSMISNQLAQLLGRAYATPGVASLRQRTKQVSSGTAVISALRAFGPSSITFVLAITQRVTDAGGRSQSTADYAVTVTGGGSNWQATDIELASAGNS